MADFLTASLVLFLLVFSFSVSADQRIITAEPGDNVILTCRAAENKDVIAVEWSRTDLESDEYVLAYRNNQSDQEGQSPSFINRVDLLDVKNGDVSLVLKKVTTDDTGIYECEVFERVNNRRKRSTVDTISIINLIVEPAKQCGAAANQGNTSRKRRSVQNNCNNPGQRNITAEPGDNVNLTCRADENEDVIIVKWSKADLESGQFVLQYKDSQFNPKLQSPSFKDRVDLLDVKNGDVSLVLKNVTTDDRGTYECRVFERGNNRRKRSILDTEPISIINLIVEPGIKDGGNKGGQKKDGGNEDRSKEDGGSKTGLIAGLLVCAVVVLLVPAVLYKRSRYSSLKSKCPPAVAAAVIGDTTLKELVEKNPKY